MKTIQWHFNIAIQCTRCHGLFCSCNGGN